MSKPAKNKKLKTKEKLETFLTKHVHKHFIQTPNKKQFESVELSEQKVWEIWHNDDSIEITIVPIISKSKYIDKNNNNLVTYFYRFQKGTAPPHLNIDQLHVDDDSDDEYMKYLGDISTPKCKFVIKRNIPNNIGNVIRSKIKYIESNPLFNDYRYPKRNNEIIKKALILQKEEEGTNSNDDYYYVDHLRRLYNHNEIQSFRQKQRKRVLSKTVLQKCVDHGANSDEFDKYLYSNSVSKRKWLQLTNMVENDEREFKKWKVRIQHIIDPSLNCRNTENNNLWIPALFKIDGNYNTKIISDINNLSRLLFNDFYNIIEKIFKFMLPMFEYIIFNSTKSKKYSLRNKTVKVVVKSQIYELYANAEYNGRLHKEGINKQNVAAVGIYYFDKDEFIKDDVFELSKGFRYFEHNELEYYININKNDCIVFNNKNRIKHALHKLTSSNSNGIVVKRKIITFFLIDPLCQNYADIESTQNIPVNKYDKYQFVVMRLFGGKISARYMTKDIVNLIIAYIYRIDLFENRAKRNAIYINRSIPKSEQEYYVDD